MGGGSAQRDGRDGDKALQKAFGRLVAAFLGQFCAERLNLDLEMAQRTLDRFLRGIRQVVRLIGDDLQSGMAIGSWVHTL